MHPRPPFTSPPTQTPTRTQSAGSSLPDSSSDASAETPSSGNAAVAAAVAAVAAAAVEVDGSPRCSTPRTSTAAAPTGDAGPTGSSFVLPAASVTARHRTGDATEPSASLGASEWLELCCAWRGVGVGSAVRVGGSGTHERGPAASECSVLRAR
jgi:hypothetical protein